MAGWQAAAWHWPIGRGHAKWPTGQLEELPTQMPTRPRGERFLRLPSHMVSVWLETIKYRKSMKCPALLNTPHFPPPFFWVLVKMKLKKNCIDAINQMVMCQSIIIVCGCLVRLKGVGFRSRDVGVADSL